MDSWTPYSIMGFGLLAIVVVLHRFVVPRAALGSVRAAGATRRIVVGLCYLAVLAALYYFFPVGEVWTWLKATFPAEAWLQDPRAVWGVWFIAGLLALIAVRLFMRWVMPAQATALGTVGWQSPFRSTSAMGTPSYVWGLAPVIAVVMGLAYIARPDDVLGWLKDYSTPLGAFIGALLLWFCGSMAQKGRGSGGNFPAHTCYFMAFFLLCATPVLFNWAAQDVDAGKKATVAFPYVPAPTPQALAPEECPGERDPFVSRWKSCIMDADSPPLKIHVPKETANSKLPKFTIGVTRAEDDLGDCLIPSPDYYAACGDVQFWYLSEGEYKDWPLDKLALRLPRRSFTITGAKTEHCVVTYKALKPGQRCG